MEIVLGSKFVVIKFTYIYWRKLCLQSLGKDAWLLTFTAQTLNPSQFNPYCLIHLSTEL